MEYDADFFLNFYERIPENKWCTGIITEGKKHCALGWVREIFHNDYIEKCLCNLFESIGTDVTTVNDYRKGKYNQPTQKQRIIAALMDKKQIEAIEEVQKIVNTETALHERNF